MPFTFFAHQLFVLPLKFAKPRWFDGTALCIGSMAPDFAYAFEATPLAFGSHAFRDQLTWSLPVAVVGTLGVRRLWAEPLGRQLPEPLGGEMRALARSRHSLWVTASSGLLGGLSHVFVDGFTHPHGWAWNRFVWLREPMFAPFTVSDVLQYIGHSAGSLLVLAMCVWLVGTHKISEWNRAQPRSLEGGEVQAWFWPFLGGGALLAIPAALSVAITGGGLPAAVMRATWMMFAVLALAALRLRRRAQATAD
jgi:Domain of unknown function (DUF4184)